MAVRHFSQVLSEMKANDPLIEVNQVWSCKNTNGEIIRKLRILAQYPNDKEKTWIYEELPSKMNKLGMRRIETCPEFNLRYVFDLEGMYDSST